MLRLVVLLCVAAVARGQTTEVNACTVFEGEVPYHTYIEGCITPPCQLPQLQNAVVNMVFRVPHTIRRMRTLANAWLTILSIPYPLGDNAETCNFLGNAYCPVIADEVVQYTLNMYIEPSFPVGVSATIEFRVVDDNDNPFICIRVPIRIVSPVNTLSALNTTLVDV